MLFILHGHRFWARKKLNELLAKARGKEGRIFKLDSGRYAPLADYLSADLFGRRVTISGEDLLQNPEYEKEIAEALSRLVSSDNLLFFLEGELSESCQERFRKAGAKLEKFKNPPPARFLAWAAGKAQSLGLDLTARELDFLAAEFEFDPWVLESKLERISLEKLQISSKKSLPEPNYFQFTDLASARRKYEALKLLRGFIKQGLGGEEAFRKLWWKIKTLRMVDSGEKNLGLHPFVLKKATEDVKHFSSEELKNLSHELMDIFSEVRRGGESFEEGLEKILLKL